MAMPLQHVGGHAGVVAQAVDDAGDAAGGGGAVVAHAVAHGVAGADLDGDARLAGELHQLLGEGQHEAVEVRAGDVLEVTAGLDAAVQRRLDHAQILVTRLGAGQLHLVEDVVIRAGDEDAGLLDALVLHQLEVLLVRTDPRGDLRELQPQILTGMQRLTVLLGVHEELRLAHQTLGASQTVEELEQMHDLIHREGADGLLTITEGGVRHPDLLGHIRGYMAHVEGDLRHGLVVEHLAIKIGLRHILQLVLIARLHQQVLFFVKLQHSLYASSLSYG